MHPQTIAFRTPREREKELSLLAKYRAIGIGSIAAAAAAIRTAPKQPAVILTRPSE